MKLITKLSMFSTLALISCGGSSNKKDDATQTEKSADAPQAQEALPESTQGTAEAPAAEAAPAATQVAQPAETAQTITVESPAAVQPAPAEALPEVVVVRVPVDANGKEVLAEAELKIQDAAAVENTENIPTAFDQGKSPKSLVKEDELDKSSSTQSWFFGRYSRGYSNFNSCYYPSYYSYGQSYSYNTYPQTYSYGSYNYYSYQRPAAYASYGYGYGSYGYGY